jgi:hypothetical protein
VVLELFDGGWLPLEEELPRIRVIVARHPAPAPDTPVTVGKRLDGWVYELFMTTLGAERFLVEDVLDSIMDVAPSRGSWRMLYVEGNPDRWCSHRECGQELWQIVCHWVWNLRLALGHTLQPGAQRELEWAPPKEAALVVVAAEPTPEEYGPWQKAAEKGRATGRFGATAFVLQENGPYAVKPGPASPSSEVRQETPFTRVAGLPRLPDGLPAQLLPGAMPGTRGQKPSCPSRQCGSPSPACPFGGDAHACCRRLDALGRCRQSSVAPHLDDALASATRRGAAP